MAWQSGLELHWHGSIEGIPTADGMYTMPVAHEFFDALPFISLTPPVTMPQVVRLNFPTKVTRAGKRS